MGNQMCIPRGRRVSKASPVSEGREEEVKSSRSKSRREKMQEELFQQQAIAFLLSQQKKRDIMYDRSRSQRGPPKPNQNLPRSASVRPRNHKDPLVQSVNLHDKGALLPKDLEAKHFVLVHGGGFGAWCWYKTLALLQDSGFKATAIDLAGAGIDSTDPNAITSLEQYVKPLTDFFRDLVDNEKVILVGHDFGGVCISYVMELFPSKISKGIFISAIMVANEQRAYDIIAKEVANPDSLLREAQKLIYANGDANPPTAIMLDKDLLKDVIFNHTPGKDVALASVSMRPIPFALFLERLNLSEENYGSVRRFFIETTDDQAITPPIQEEILKSNPPDQVFQIKGSDHCPFFSKPQALHKLLIEISQMSTTSKDKK